MSLRLLEGYRGYVITDDYAGYNALALKPGVERLACMAHARRKFVEAQKVHLKGKTGRADVALTMINKLYGVERDIKMPAMNIDLSVVRNEACRSLRS